MIFFLCVCDNLSSLSFRSDLKIFEWMKTALTTFTSNSRKRSCQKFHDYLACEFTVHYTCRNAETDLTYGLNFLIIIPWDNSKRLSWGRYIDRYILLFCCTCARVHFSLVIALALKKFGSTINFLKMRKKTVAVNAIYAIS